MTFSRTILIGPLTFGTDSHSLSPLASIILDGSNADDMDVDMETTEYRSFFPLIYLVAGHLKRVF